MARTNMWLFTAWRLLISWALVDRLVNLPCSVKMVGAEMQQFSVQKRQALQPCTLRTISGPWARSRNASLKKLYLSSAAFGFFPTFASMLSRISFTTSTQLSLLVGNKSMQKAPAQLMEYFSFKVVSLRLPKSWKQAAQKSNKNQQKRLSLAPYSATKTSLVDRNFCFKKLMVEQSGPPLRKILNWTNLSTKR